MTDKPLKSEREAIQTLSVWIGPGSIEHEMQLTINPCHSCSILQISIYDNLETVEPITYVLTKLDKTPFKGNVNRKKTPKLSIIEYVNE